MCAVTILHHEQRDLERRRLAACNTIQEGDLLVSVVVWKPLKPDAPQQQQAEKKVQNFAKTGSSSSHCISATFLSTLAFFSPPRAWPNQIPGRGEGVCKMDGADRDCLSDRPWLLSRRPHKGMNRPQLIAGPRESLLFLSLRTLCIPSAERSQGPPKKGQSNLESLKKGWRLEARAR